MATSRGFLQHTAKGRIHQHSHIDPYGWIVLPNTLPRLQCLAARHGQRQEQTSDCNECYLTHAVGNTQCDGLKPPLALPSLLRESYLLPPFTCTWLNFLSFYIQSTVQSFNHLSLCMIYQCTCIENVPKILIKT